MALLAVALFAWAEAAADRSRREPDPALSRARRRHVEPLLRGADVPVPSPAARRSGRGGRGSSIAACSRQWRSRSCRRCRCSRSASAASAQSATSGRLVPSFDQMVDTYYFLLEPLFVRRFAVVLLILLVVIGAVVAQEDREAGRNRPASAARDCRGIRRARARSRKSCLVCSCRAGVLRAEVCVAG